MAELIMQEEASAPSTPASGKWVAYFKSDGLYIKDDAGTELGPLGVGGGGGLTNSIASVTTSNVTGVVGTRHILNVSGMTANRNFVLPAGAADDEIEVNLSVGDATYALILIGDTGISINGGTAATEWSRLFVTGETVRFVATSASNWNVVLDGRKSSVGSANRNTTQSITTATLTKASLNNSLSNVGDVVDVVTNNRINIRRTGQYSVSALTAIAFTLDDQEQLQCLIYVNGVIVTYSASWVSAGVSDRVIVATMSTVLSLTAGDYVELWIYHTEGASQNTNTTIYPALSLFEIL